MILAVARVRDCAYGWHADVPLAPHSGINDEEIRAIADGSYTELREPERAAVSYAVDNVTNSVTDETHANLPEQFDDRAIITISTLASEYARICSTIDAFGMEIDGAFID